MVFTGCKSLTEITLPSTITDIGQSAFYNCTALESIVLPENITSIEYGVFLGCQSLKSIVIHADITHIGTDAFGECTNLEEVIFENPEGWEIGETPIDAANLADPKTAAIMLGTTHSAMDWRRT